MAFVSRVRLHVARDALKAAWKPGYSYMKAGIMLLDLCPATKVQGDLWTARTTGGHSR